MTEDRNAQVVITADTTQYTQGVQQASRETDGLNKSVTALAASMDGLMKRSGKKLVLFAAADMAALSGATMIAATLDKQLSTLSATASAMNKSFSMSQVRSEIRSISRELPMARGEIAQLATSITKLGITTAREVSGMTRSFAMFGAATGESPFTLAQQQIGLSRTMGNLIGGTQRVTNLNDSVTSLAANAGVNATDILGFSQQIAPAARMAGMSQQDVMGVSTAFNRAGADGQYASTAFTSVLNEITRMRASGSPELKRYGRVLGLSDKEMGNGKEGLTPLSIFDRIIQKVGPGTNQNEAIKTLDMLGLDGIRMTRAFQSLGAEGGMGKWVQESREAYGSGSTEKGAEAAENNLVDVMEKLRNNFTDMGQAIGEIFIRPVTELAKLLTLSFQKFNEVMQPAIKAFGLLAGVVGTLAGALGTIMQVAGPLTTALLARRFLNNTVQQSITGGWRNRGATTGDLSDPKVAARYAGVDANGNPVSRLGVINRGLYRMSGWLGQHAENAGMPGGFGPKAAANLGIAGLGSGFRTFTRWMGQDYAKAGLQSGVDRINYNGSGRGPFAAFRDGWKGGFGQELFGQKVEGPLTKEDAANASPRSMREMASAAKANVIAAKAEAQARANSGTSMKAAGAQFKSLVVETAKLTGAFLKASSAVGAGLLGAGLKAGGQGMLGAAKAAGGWLKGNAMAMGSMAAMAVGFDMFNTNSAYADDRGAARDSGSFNGVVAYDTALGKTTDRLLGFANALDETTGKLGANAQTVEEALKASDLSARGLNKEELTNQTVNGLTSTSSAVDWMMSQGQLSADQANLMGEDIYKKFGKTDGDTIMRQYLALTKGGKNVKPMNGVSQSFYDATADDNFMGGAYKSVGNAINAVVGGNPLSDVFDSISGGKYLTDERKAQVAIGVNQILAKGAWQDEKMTSKNPAFRDKYRAAVDAENITQALVSQMRGARDVDGGKKAGLTEILNALDSQGVAVNKEAFSGGWDFTGKTDAELAKWVDENILQNTQYAQKEFDGVSTAQIAGSGTKRTISKSAEETVEAMDKFSSDFKGFAKDFAEDKKLQNAITNHSGDPRFIIAAAETMRKDAMKRSGGDDSKAMAMLTALAENSPKAVEAANYAKSIIAADQERKMSTMNLASRGQVLTQHVEAAQLNVKEGVTGSDQELKDAKEAQKDYIVSVYTAKRDLDRQLERSDEDYQIQKTRSDNAFHRSLQRSEYDHNLQLLYAKKDFHREMRNSDEDYYRNLKYMAKDAAKSIYDPFARVQSQSVISAKGLIVNLKDQNQRIKQQTKELDQARALGLSQDAIDMLGLADPAKAQQLHYMLETGGKKWVSELNKTVGERGKATKDLTMDERNNESLRRMDEQRKIQIKRSTDAYDRNLRRGEKAYNRSLEKSIADYERGMRHMEKDRQKMLNRARQDFFGYVEDVKMGYKKMIKYVMNSIDDPSNALNKSLKKMLKTLDQVTGTKRTPSASDPSGGGGGYYANSQRNSGEHGGRATDARNRRPRRDGMSRGNYNGGDGGDGNTGLWNQWGGWGGVADNLWPDDVFGNSGVDYYRDHPTSVSNSSYHTRNKRSQLSASGGGNFSYNNSTNFNGAIKVEASDPNEMARKLKHRQRMDALRQGNRRPISA